MMKLKFSLVFLLLISSFLLSLTLVKNSSAQNINSSINSSINISSDEINRGGSLIRIFTENKVGFIDKTGKLVIPPKFANAYDFSEGLAPARLDSKYGFINGKGDFVIQPKYDFAQGFRNGAAAVNIDSIAGLLYKDGREIFFPNYRSIKFFSNAGAFVTTKSGNLGVIDNTGKLIVDTVYRAYSAFSHGNTILHAVKPNYKEGSAGDKWDLAMMDTNGVIIAPLGQYKYINQDANGYSIVSHCDTIANNCFTGFINAKGKLIYKKENTDWQLQDSIMDLRACINDSLFIVTMGFVLKDKKTAVMSYNGILNSATGKIISDKTWMELFVVSDNCIILRARENENLDSKYYAALINNKGKIINRKYESYFNSNGNGKYIIVNKGRFHGVIDTKGNEIVPLQGYRIQDVKTIGEGYFISTGYYDGFDFAQIMFDLNGDAVWLADKNVQLYKNKNSFSGTDKSKYYCYNNEGDLLYSGKLYGKENFVNIDYMREPDYYSAVTLKKIPGKILSGNNTDAEINKEGFSIFIDTGEEAIYREHYKGMKVYTMNLTDSPLPVGSSGNISIKLQAKDTDGNWRYIETDFLRLRCDNEEQEVNLSINEMLESVIPRFQGDFRTVLRAELKYERSSEGRKTIYSNEVECKINRSQFWRKQQEAGYDYGNPYTR